MLDRGGKFSATVAGPGPRGAVVAAIQEQTMSTWLKLLSLAVLLTVSACVSAGDRAINDDGVVSQIQVGKSTQADVTALLGYPLRASYGQRGGVIWYYTAVTMAPAATDFVPVVKAFTPVLPETVRHLAVTFNRDGTVENLDSAPIPQGSGSSG
jgi:outer membrane protein assembly factor BamE (lipoprotein component of BamABCDE complex)